MPTSAAHVRFSVTLPANLVTELDRETVGGGTRSEVIRTRLEASYRGDALQQEIVQLRGELQAFKGRMEALVARLEARLPAPEAPEPEPEMPIATYEHMYGPIDLSNVGVIRQRELPVPKKRWWGFWR